MEIFPFLRGKVNFKLEGITTALSGEIRYVFIKEKALFRKDKGNDK